MLTIGLDFDNTLVNYDHVFYKLALEKGLIKSDLNKNKISVRNELRKQGKEELFTLLQGEVYGRKILEVKPSFDLLEQIRTLIKSGHKVVIISHKTKKPFLGPEYDLHKAAMEWLYKNGFFDQNLLNLSVDDVYLELTLEEKIERINKTSCDVFIDDLPEVLNKLPEKVTGVHYNTTEKSIKTDFLSFSEWKNLSYIINAIIMEKTKDF